MTLARMRYAFERWLQSAYKLTDTEHGRDGYTNPHTALAWAAWKGGRAYLGSRGLREMVLGDLYATDQLTGHNTIERAR